VDLALGKDGVLSVHKLVHEYSQRVGIEDVGFVFRALLEGSVIEIWDFSLLLELVAEFFVHGHWLPNLGNPVFDVDVLDMQHAQTLNS